MSIAGSSGLRRRLGHLRDMIRCKGGSRFEGVGACSKARRLRGRFVSSLEVSDRISRHVHDMKPAVLTDYIWIE